MCNTCNSIKGITVHWRYKDEQEQDCCPEPADKNSNEWYYEKAQGVWVNSRRGTQNTQQDHGQLSETSDP